MHPMSGRVIAGRYCLAEPIGRGAMGVVWRARDELLDREVAVKEVLVAEALGEEERANAYKRTLREAKTAARLSHRGVVTVYDVAEEDGRPWIIMELVQASSLDQVIAESGPLSPRRAGRVGEQLLAALASAHAAGVLHRDVKPSNVLLGADDRAVLTDFGIAEFQGDPRLTQTGMVMGSPGFTAPERIRGGAATPASDLWSLGATLYTAIEGRGPYEARGGAITTMSAIINEDAPLAPSAGPLSGVIAALLRRDPDSRPNAMTAARMIGDIMPLLVDRPAGWVATQVSAVGGAGAMEAPRAVDGAAGAALDAVAADAAGVAFAGVNGGAAGVAGAEAGASALAGAGAGAGPAGPGAAEAPTAVSPSLAPLDSMQSAYAPPPAPPSEPVVPPPSASPLSAPLAPADSPPPSSPGQPLFAPRFGPGHRGPDAGSLADPPTTPEQAFPYRAPYAASGSAAPPGPVAPAGPIALPGPAARPARRRGRGRWKLALAGVAVIAAAAGGSIAAFAFRGHQSAPGTAAAGVTGSPPGPIATINEPVLGTLPAGFTRGTVTPQDAGTQAGFTVGVPGTWQPVRRTLKDTIFYAPEHGGHYLEIDLTPHVYDDMLDEARYIKRNALASGHFPGYHQLLLERTPIRGYSGAVWKFTWLNSDGVRMQAEDLLFIANTAAGPQSYALYLSAPAASWNADLATFDQELRTFQLVTGS